MRQALYAIANKFVASLYSVYHAFVQDTSHVVARLEDFLADHNASSKRPMSLALFLYAAEHVSRACRVLRQPGGHLLNVGVGALLF